MFPLSKICLAALLAVFASAVVNASKFSVDINGPTSTSAILCLGGQITKNEDLWYNLIVRVGQSASGLDTDASQTLNNAAAAALNAVDGYIEFCPKKQNTSINSTEYVREILVQLRNFDVLNFVQSIYLTVVDNDGSCWDSDSNKNVENINDAIAAFDVYPYNKTFGILTNADQWQKITNNYAGLPNDTQLWWASEGAPTFSDFVPFGSWKKAELRQFQLSTAEKPVKQCGLTVNKNFGQDDYLCQQEGRLCDGSNRCCGGLSCTTPFITILPNPPDRCLEACDIPWVC